MGLLSFLAIGAIAGWLAGQFMKGNGIGLVGDIVVGVAGAFLGYLFQAAGLELGGVLGSVVVAFLGAVLLLFVVRFFTGGPTGRRLWS